MSQERRRTPSMRDFDHFAEEAAEDHEQNPEQLDGPPAGLDDHLQAYRWRSRMRFRFLLTMLVFFGVAVWFLKGYREDIAYAFGSARQPLRLGQVTDISPPQIPPNQYVEVTGITEHRGMRQKLVRGLGLSRKEYWYFRLLGSQGVFIEVSPDAERWGFAEEVTVAGRAVDPARMAVYNQLFADYAERYAPRPQPTLRVIRVGERPGEGRTPYVVACVVLAIVVALNLVALVRLVRQLRRRPG